jgi:hypothetical protein
MILIEYKVESEYNQTTQRASAWVLRRIPAHDSVFADDGPWVPVMPPPRCEAAAGLVIHERAAVAQLEEEIERDVQAAIRLGIPYVREGSRIALHPPPADPHVQRHEPRAKHLRRST